MKRRVATGALLVALLACARGAHAHLEHPLLSTRTASMGGAFVALANDPSATVDNPAGLAGLATVSLLATWNRPWGVEGLNEGYLAASVPTPWMTVGVSWFHRGLDDALGEDLVTLAVARDLKRTSEDASLSVGASVDFARVSAQGDIDDSDDAIAFGAGVLLRPFAFIGVGYSIRNANQPDLHLVDGAPGTALKRSQSVGLAYYWQERMVVTVETREEADGEWRSRGGLELRAGNHVLLRSGLDATRVAVGVGLVWRAFALDAGMTGHEALGASYLLTLRWARAKEVPSYGASQ